MASTDARNATPYLISGLSGGLGWFLIAVTSGREAWDTDLYLPMLIALVVLAGAVGFLYPRRPWRWGLAQFGAQASVAFLFNPTGGLLPLGLILFLFLSIPSILSACIGGFVARRFIGAS
jgi:hypothetical protein